MRAGDVGEVSEREFVAREVLGLREPALVDVEHLAELALARRHHLLVPLLPHERRERQVEDQLRARRAEAVRLRLQPLLYRRALQRARAEQLLVPALVVAPRNVAANLS